MGAHRHVTDEAQRRAITLPKGTQLRMELREAARVEHQPSDSESKLLTAVLCSD